MTHCMVIDLGSMVIDSEGPVTEALVLALTTLYPTMTCQPYADFADALAALRDPRQRQPDVILLALDSAGAPAHPAGLDALRLASPAPLIAMTDLNPQWRRSALQHGAAFFVLKPDLSLRRLRLVMDAALLLRPSR